MLQASELAIEVAGRTVLSGGSFQLRDGDKVGLVGRNGVGKTSLLRVLAGEAQPAGGVVLRRGTLGYVPQDPRPDRRAIDADSAWPVSTNSQNSRLPLSSPTIVESSRAA